ncbi:MAG: signal peptidase I [Massilia sp.]
MKRWLHHNKGFIAFLFLFGIFRTAVADWNPIPSGSMRPNLLEGDVVFVNRLAFNLKVPLTDIIVTRTGEPKRGDVVTFSSPADGTRLIKRIVALPGDVVEMHGDQLIINGKPASYTPLSFETEQVRGQDTPAQRLREASGASVHTIQLLPTVQSRRDFAAVTVPPDQFLMLGDNRNNSGDSRFFGFVPRALLIGRAERVLVSADLDHHWRPRTERFGQKLE